MVLLTIVVVGINHIIFSHLFISGVCVCVCLFLSVVVVEDVMCVVYL